MPLWVKRPRDAGEVFEAAAPGNRDVLGDAVVVVAADGMIVRLLADPVDARRRLEAVIDQVAQAQADVVRLGDGIQGPASWRGCRPIKECA